MIAAAGPALAALAAAGSVRWAARGARRALVRSRLSTFAPPPPRPTAPPRVARLLDDAGLDLDAATVWSAWRCVPAVVAGLVGILGGPALAILAGAATAATPLLVSSALRGRGDRRRAAAVAPFLESVAGSLRSGASVVAALREAAARPPAPLATDLSQLANRLDAGDRLSRALDAWVADRPLAEVRLAVAALRLAAESGGRSARAVDGVAATVRSRTAVAAEARALGTQARYSAGVIAAAPLAFAAVAAVADPRSATFLTRTPLGLVFLSSGLLLDGLGCWWMARLTARVA